MRFFSHIPACLGRTGCSKQSCPISFLLKWIIIIIITSKNIWFLLGTDGKFFDTLLAFPLLSLQVEGLRLFFRPVYMPTPQHADGADLQRDCRWPYNVCFGFFFVCLFFSAFKKLCLCNNNFSLTAFPCFSYRWYMHVNTSCSFSSLPGKAMFPLTSQWPVIVQCFYCHFLKWSNPTEVNVTFNLINNSIGRDHYFVKKTRKN